MNKPVAWIWSEDGYDIGVCLEQDKQMGKEFEQYSIPLYTHPVKEEAEQQSYQEADGCPTELAVLKRFWRQHNPVKELKNIAVASATCSCGKVMEVTNLQPVKELDRELLDKTIIEQQNEIKDLRKNLDIALMIVNKPKLTDEEIEIECRKAWGLHEQDQLNLAEVFKFARAILRKAQEK